MKKTVCVLTSTRAEYGLLKPVMVALQGRASFETKIVVTGAHLSPEFGLTYQEILKDGISIDEKIEMLLSSDTPSSITKSMGLGMIGFADYFGRTKPDLLIVLGDRYETMAVAMAAMNQMIPIAHLHGGETTEGAIDEVVRHALTKMSYLHFTSTEAYRKRVIQMGEAPERVFCVGATAVENIKNEKLLTRKKLQESLDFSLEGPFVLVTYHPVTLELEDTEQQIEALLAACGERPSYQYIFTKANADANGRVVNEKIEAFVSEHANAKVFASLGLTRYLSAMKHCEFVLGNSSSGIIEAPLLGKPTVNIGDRQRGRIQAQSTINCEATTKAIVEAMALAGSETFKKMAKTCNHPYGAGDTSQRIATIVEDFVCCHPLDLKKSFYDIGVE